MNKKRASIDININMIFNLLNFYKYIKFLILFTTLLLSLEFLLLNTSYDNYKRLTISNINSFIKSDNAIGIAEICMFTNCNSLEYRGVTYGTCGHKLKPTTRDELKYKQHNMIIESILINHIDIYTVMLHNEPLYIDIPDVEYLNNMFNLVYYNIIILIFLFTLIYYGYVYKSVTTTAIEKRTLELELESKIQRTMSESAYHEMILPLAVVKTMFSEFIKELYPCVSNNTNVCARVISFNGNSCTNKDHKELLPSNVTNLDSNKYYSRIILAIEQLETALAQMAEVKHIKYSNGTVSMLELLTNAVCTVNGTSVLKLNLSLREADKELLDRFSVKKPLNNGSMLNILNNHIVNSKEAKASTIKVKAILRNNFIDIYLGDNGVGIRNKYNKIINVEDIFKSGYSTKDSYGTAIEHNKSLITTLKDIINTKFLFKNTQSSRGDGLAINKLTLVKAGGDVELVSTNTTGTIFKLSIPIKKRVK